MTCGAARLCAFLISCLPLAMGCSQAAGARLYKVPKKIPSDCLVPVEDEIMAWLATVPNGNTVQFAAGGCYGQDGPITLSGRRDLVIDGQGAQFRTVTAGGPTRANWRFNGGANLSVQNMAVWGSNPEGRYRAGFEWQHGFSVEGVQGCLLGTKNRVELRAVRNAQISSNTVTLTPTVECGTRTGALIQDSHTVGISFNVFSGANSVFTADTLSGGITASDNSTS
jgi:hypothetical protein